MEDQNGVTSSYDQPQEQRTETVASSVVMFFLKKLFEIIEEMKELKQEVAAMRTKMEAIELNQTVTSPKIDTVKSKQTSMASKMESMFTKMESLSLTHSLTGDTLTAKMVTMEAIQSMIVSRLEGLDEKLDTDLTSMAAKLKAAETHQTVVASKLVGIETNLADLTKVLLKTGPARKRPVPKKKAEVKQPLPDPLVGALLTLGGTFSTRRDYCLVYFPSRNKWSEFGQLPRKLYGASIVLIGNVLYLCGGQEKDSTLSSIYAMNVTQKMDRKWRHVANLPGIAGHACAVLGTKIYMIGGRPDPMKCYVFDTATGVLMPIAGLTTSNWSSGLVAHQTSRSLYAMQLNNWPQALRYDALTDKWHAVSIKARDGSASQPTVRAGHRLVMNGGQNEFYNLGGRDSKEVELFTIDPSNLNALTFEKLPDMPVARHWPGVAVLDGHLYVAGGRGGSGMEKFNPSTGSWDHCAAMPSGEIDNFELLPIRMPSSVMEKLTFL